MFNVVDRLKPGEHTVIRNRVVFGLEKRTTFTLNSFNIVLIMFIDGKTFRCRFFEEIGLHLCIDSAIKGKHAVFANFLHI